MKLILLVVALLLTFFAFEAWNQKKIQATLDASHTILQSAVDLKNPQEKSKRLNQALSLLVERNESSPQSPTLNAEIGKILFQLDERPLATLYNKRAAYYNHLEKFKIAWTLSLITLLIVLMLPLKKPLQLAILPLLPFLFFSFSLLYFYYFSPLEGVLLRATPFYQNPSESSQVATNAPLKAGSLFTLLDVVENGEWAKIGLPNHTFGYVKSDTFKLIE